MHGGHAHKDCHKVTDIKEWKDIFRKYARCFVCAIKGHLARECRSNRSCEQCGGGTMFRFLRGRICRSRRQWVNLSLLCLQFPPKKRSIKRKIWVEVTTSGQTNGKGVLLKVVKVNVSPVGMGKSVKIEAYVVSDISKVRDVRKVQNEHVEVVKIEYPHLKNVWFSNVKKGKEALSIDALVGSDYLWYFQQGKKWGGGGGGESDPVAVQIIKLGWVLLGPLKRELRQGLSLLISMLQNLLHTLLLGNS